MIINDVKQGDTLILKTGTNTKKRMIVNIKGSYYSIDLSTGGTCYTSGWSGAKDSPSEIVEMYQRIGYEVTIEE